VINRNSFDLGERRVTAKRALDRKQKSTYLTVTAGATS
jgi:hypothetical protein